MKKENRAFVEAALRLTRSLGSDGIVRCGSEAFVALLETKLAISVDNYITGCRITIFRFFGAVRVGSFR